MPLVWQSRLQSAVADSTTEAELTAAHVGAKLAESYRVILASLFQREIGLNLLCDNQAAVTIVRSGEDARSEYGSR